MGPIRRIFHGQKAFAPLLMFVVAATASLSTQKAAPATPETALDRYVHAPDPHFHYELVRSLAAPGYTAYVLDMTSQQWLTEAEVNHPVWKHWLVILKPDVVKTSVGLLYINRGSLGRPAPDKADPELADIAVSTGAVVADLHGIPNEPLVFADETHERTEDAIIAYTWDKFLRTGDAKWPARLPMTKAAVRAMDATSGFLASEAGGKVLVDRYVVAGESKRGWTTWTTAAVDRRVVAVIPMVIDMLNIGPSFRHQYRVYGGYSRQVADYVQAGIMDWDGTVEFRNLMKIEEPFEYRQRLTMPKFIINASGDQYFLPDSSQFYFDQLSGEKYLRYVPNADHAVTKNTDAAQSAEAFFASIVKGKPRPQFTWKLEDSRIVVDTRTEPMAVRLWQATNPDARDFRLEKIGPAYHSTDLKPVALGKYVAELSKPAKGYTAYFVELTYPSESKYPFKFTTGVKVVPDVEPYPPPKANPPAGSHPIQ
jgi:PhoPQ-activated pathogenicity-related protein